MALTIFRWQQQIILFTCSLTGSVHCSVDVTPTYIFGAVNFRCGAFCLSFFPIFPFIHLILFNADVASILICCVEKFLSCVCARASRFPSCALAVAIVVVLRQCAKHYFFHHCYKSIIIILLALCTVWSVHVQMWYRIHTTKTENKRKRVSISKE